VAENHGPKPYRKTKFTRVQRERVGTQKTSKPLKPGNKKVVHHLKTQSRVDGVRV